MSGPLPTEPTPVRKRTCSSSPILTIEEESMKRSPSSTAFKAAQSHRMAILIKYGSLLLLVGQMVGLVVLMRYSRTRHSEDGELYLASTAVFMMEVMKFSLCLGVVFFQGNCSVKALRSELYTHVWASPFELIKLCVPSFLYTVQNNLLYLALTNLDAASYQVLYQLKILTTAIFSATMLGTRFSATKWASLVVLMCGVAVVETSGSSTDNKSENKDQNHLVGLVAVLSAACTSGFSGVYFERILKGSEVTLWIRNIQMGLFSIAIAFVTAIVQDSAQISRKGFFVGYSPIVLTVITVQAVGGLIVAVVIKYADNVLKVYASSFSILLSCLISALAFDFRPNKSFMVGASLVLVSTVMYSAPSKSDRPARDVVLPLVVQNGTPRKSSLVL
jgi:UDP-sugar transporter A1/2/3